MSDHPFFHGWKSRLFYLTRDRRFLLRTAFGIATIGFMLGLVFATLRRQSLPMPDTVVPGFLVRLQEDYGRLHQATEAKPRELTVWLATLMERVVRSEDADQSMEKSISGYEQDGRVLNHDLRALLDKHSTAETRPLFERFIAATLHFRDEKGPPLRKEIEATALRQPPVPYANEFAASLAIQRQELNAAVTWLLREGSLFTDAVSARQKAVHLAIEIKDVEQLREMRDTPGWMDDCSLDLQRDTGALLTDVLLQWRAMFFDHFHHIAWTEFIFTLLAGAVWTFILVQHDEKDHGRWLQPVLPVIAGVASVWPTMSLLYWQEHVQGLTENGDQLHKLWYYTIGVATREEVSKLALFALFLPWLLAQRAPCRALLTGAFVGLGFAIEENVAYYHGGLSHVVSRLLTANFFHLALSGIAAHSFYRMFRSGFATAGEFVATFASVIAAHGLYDWLIDTDALDMGSWLSIVLFCVIALRFFDLLAQEADLKRSTFSLRAAFLLGTATIVALIFILAGLQGGDTRTIAETGATCTSIVPIAVLYWRRFEHA